MSSVKWITLLACLINTKPTQGEIMKACAITQFGGDEAIEYIDVAIPELAQDEILIKNLYASVNPVDWKVRAGYFSSFLSGYLPLILGRDFCGEVVKVGSHVKNFKTGDIVCGYIPFIEGHPGTFAEYVSVSQELACKVPSTVSETAAASLPLIGLTAWQGIFEHIQLQKGERLLVLGGTSSVGNIAVQLAKMEHAEVFASARRENFDHLRSLGVSHCIDYKTKDFSSISHNSLDAAYDCVGSEEELEKAIHLVKKGGKVVTICLFPLPQHLVDLAHAKNIDFKNYILHPSKADLEKVMSLLSQKKLVLRPVELLEFSEIPEALAKSERGHSSKKMVVKIN